MNQQDVLFGGGLRLEEVFGAGEAGAHEAIVQVAILLRGKDVDAEVQVVPFGVHQPQRPYPRSDCSAVTTATLKMSSAEQPRERSLAGLARPCRNGPIAMAPPSRSTSLYPI